MHSIHIYERGVFRPWELDMLYRVFDEACRLKRVSPESVEARELALSILALYNAGMVDEHVLLAAVAFRQGYSYQDT